MSSQTNQWHGPQTTVQWIIGCGEVFESLADDLQGYGLQHAGTRWHRFESVAAIAPQADEVISSLWAEAGRCTIFAAVDAHAMNHARLELYGRARLKGMKLGCLVHRTAILSPSVRLSDNVWVGPGTVMGRESKVRANTFIGAGARLDASVEIGPHGWIGSGARLGAGCKLAQHAVIGADAVLRAGTTLGRHVALEEPGPWEGEIPAGTCVERGARAPAVMIGPGYTYTRREGA